MFATQVTLWQCGIASSAFSLDGNSSTLDELNLMYTYQDMTYRWSTIRSDYVSTGISRDFDSALSQLP